MDPTSTEAPRTRLDSLQQRALERAAHAAERTDTIIATPAAIHLRVGDSVPWFGTLRLEAHDRTGAVVPGFAPLLRAGPASVVTLRGLYVVAVGPGQGTLFVQASHGRDMRPPDQRPLTRVPIDVSAP